MQCEDNMKSTCSVITLLLKHWKKTQPKKIRYQLQFFSVPLSTSECPPPPHSYFTSGERDFSSFAHSNQKQSRKKLQLLSSTLYEVIFSRNIFRHKFFLVSLTEKLHFLKSQKRLLRA